MHDVARVHERFDGACELLLAHEHVVGVVRRHRHDAHTRRRERLRNRNENADERDIEWPANAEGVPSTARDLTGFDLRDGADDRQLVGRSRHREEGATRSPRWDWCIVSEPANGERFGQNVEHQAMAIQSAPVGRYCQGLPAPR